STCAQCARFVPSPVCSSRVPPPPRSTLFPYTTLFRSVPDGLVSGWRTVGDIARYPNLLGDAGAVVAAVGSIAFTLGLIAVGTACVIAIAVRVRGDRPDAEPAA